MNKIEPRQKKVVSKQFLKVILKNKVQGEMNGF